MSVETAEAWELSSIKKVSTTITDDMVTMADVVKASKGLVPSVIDLRRLYTRNVLVRPARIQGKVYYKREYVDCALTAYFVLKMNFNLSTQAIKVILGANRGKEKDLAANIKEFIKTYQGKQAYSATLETRFIDAIKVGEPVNLETMEKSVKDLFEGDLIPQEVVKAMAKHRGRPRKTISI